MTIFAPSTPWSRFTAIRDLTNKKCRSSNSYCRMTWITPPRYNSKIYISFKSCSIFMGGIRTILEWKKWQQNREVPRGRNRLKWHWQCAEVCFYSGTTSRTWHLEREDFWSPAWPWASLPHIFRPCFQHLLPQMLRTHATASRRQKKKLKMKSAVNYTHRVHGRGGEVGREQTGNCGEE